MISRRYLRVKAFQTYYAYIQKKEANISNAEKELLLSVNRLYDLYILFLLLPGELVHMERVRLDQAKHKRMKTSMDLNPKLSFVDNELFTRFKSSPIIGGEEERRALSWSQDLDRDMLVKLLEYVKVHPRYQEYMKIEKPSFAEQKSFVTTFYKKIVPNFELLLDRLQDRSIFWNFDDVDFALNLAVKTTKQCKEDDETLSIFPMLKDEDDKRFALDLLRNTIRNEEEYEELIDEQTKNWDVERIAMTDIALMKMGIAELTTFSSIPVKVTLNEYIELSKWFSSSKSKVFINGVLDKLVILLTEEGKIVKSGRGLVSE